MGRSRRRGIRRGEKAWAETVRQFEASGLSLAAFCRGKGLPLSSLRRWRQRVGRRGSGGFVELVPSPEAPSPSSAGWSLELWKERFAAEPMRSAIDRAVKNAAS